MWSLAEPLFTRTSITRRGAKILRLGSNGGPWINGAARENMEARRGGSVEKSRRRSDEAAEKRGTRNSELGTRNRGTGELGNWEQGTGNLELGPRNPGRGLQVSGFAALREAEKAASGPEELGVARCGCENRKGLGNSDLGAWESSGGSAARGGRCPNGSFTNFVGGRGKTCSGNWAVAIMGS